MATVSTVRALSTNKSEKANAIGFFYQVVNTQTKVSKIFLKRTASHAVTRTLEKLFAIKKLEK